MKFKATILFLVLVAGAILLSPGCGKKTKIVNSPPPAGEVDTVYVQVVDTVYVYPDSCWKPGDGNPPWANKGKK